MKKVTLVTVLTLSFAFLTTSNIKADENPITNEPITTVTSTPATTSVEPTSESPITKTNVPNAQPTALTSTSETTITKSDTQITVTNPKVTIDQSDGAGKYNTFKVKYENITIPDEIPVNEGDKVVLTLPKEVKFQTSFDFDVKNPTQDVVGKAYADSESGKLTTIFNNYFHTHPLNKQMSLTFDARWTDVVEPGKPVSANFDGTIVTTNIEKEQEVGKDELIAKWGSQDKDDPTVINWTIRVNYARRILNVVKLLDTMSDNQKLVDNYLDVQYVDNVEPWIYAGDAKELVKSMVKTENGFELTLNRLERMVYINYKTKLINPVKDSVNPTNKVTLTSNNITASSTFRVSLVGGQGDAIGENKPKPTWELPNEAPTVEIPEVNINDIPLMPPAPVVDIPELPLEDIPLLPPAPILEKSELPLEDIPLMPPAPVVDIPELPLKDIPILPPAPILEKPEISLENIPSMPPAPVVDIPELPLEDIPLLPPAPILEKPELPLEDIPLMPPAPAVDIPELPLEDIPLLPPAPILEKPELSLEDIPLMPPAPILELPELKITEEPKETPTNSTTVDKHNKPKENTPVPTTPVSHSVSQDQNSEHKPMLPNTGESPSTLLFIIGLIVLSASVVTLLQKK